LKRKKINVIHRSAANGNTKIKSYIVALRRWRLRISSSMPGHIVNLKSA
jgi:hypothetical protein